MDTPPVSLDVSDPWGAPQAAAESLVVETVQNEDGRVTVPGDGEDVGWDYGAAGGWGDVSSRGMESAEPAMVEDEADSDTPPTRQTEDVNPVWSLDSPVAQVQTLPSSPPRESSEPPAPISTHPPPPSSGSQTPTYSANFDRLPSLTEGFGSPESHSRPPSFESPRPTFDAQDASHGFSAAATSEIPQSPSLGDGDFGGFSTGGFSSGFDRDDPWGGGGAGGVQGPGGSASPPPEWDIGGTGMEQSTSGFDEQDAEGDEGGWGGGRPPAAVQVSKGEDMDWEEAQRRIRLQEELAVSGSLGNAAFLIPCSRVKWLIA
jgi:hypothetical protein